MSVIRKSRIRTNISRRISVNIVSGWFKLEFTSIGQWWLDHAERYRRSNEFIRCLKGELPDHASFVALILGSILGKTLCSATFVENPLTINYLRKTGIWQAPLSFEITSRCALSLSATNINVHELWWYIIHDSQKALLLQCLCCRRRSSRHFTAASSLIHFPSGPEIPSLVLTHHFWDEY